MKLTERKFGKKLKINTSFWKFGKVAKSCTKCKYAYRTVGIYRRRWGWCRSVEIVLDEIEKICGGFHALTDAG